MLGVVAVGLTFLWAVDAAEADALRVVVVQNFNRVAVEDGDHFAGVFGGIAQNSNAEDRGQN